MNKQKAIELRRKAQNLSKGGMKKSKIVQVLGISRPTLDAWLNLKNIEEDNRGWQKGQKRKFTVQQEKLVVQKRNELADKFFLEQKRFSKN